MLDTLTHFNYADFKQRYQGVWGWLPKQESIPVAKFVRVTHVDSERVRFTDVNGTDFYAEAGKLIKFEFIPVDRGWFQGQTFLCFMERVPARQWKRGISGENTGIFLFSDDTSRLLNMGPGWEVLHDVFVKQTKYADWVPAFLKGTKDYAAFSKHFAITTKHLWFYNKQVGTVKNRSIIELYSDIIKQELTDCFRRNNYEGFFIV